VGRTVRERQPGLPARSLRILANRSESLRIRIISDADGVAVPST
jgi:hypothetical protein